MKVVNTAYLELIPYLQYYVGCDALTLDNGSKIIGKFEAICGFADGNPSVKLSCFYDFFDMTEFEYFKLILCCPTRMSEHIRRKYYSLCKVLKLHDGKNAYADTAESFHYAIMQGVDMFDLIEKGFAVEKRDKEIRGIPTTFID